MANHNPYELERVSIRLVRDAVTPMISDTPLNNPEAVVRKIYGMQSSKVKNLTMKS